MKPDLEEIARDELGKLIANLPAEIREGIADLPVTFDARAIGELEDDGFDETLGLFVGGDVAHLADDPIPSQIILFLENIWSEVDEDPELFRKEIRVTFLHEVGHYLGLDELDLDERGLQ